MPLMQWTGFSLFRVALQVPLLAGRQNRYIHQTAKADRPTVARNASFCEWGITSMG